MKILLEKLQNLEKAEKAANLAESAWEKEPESPELEKTFDSTYKAEFDAYINAAKCIEYLTGGNIDFMAAKKMIQTKRAELLQILAV